MAQGDPGGREGDLPVTEPCHHPPEAAQRRFRCVVARGRPSRARRRSRLCRSRDACQGRVSPRSQRNRGNQWAGVVFKNKRRKFIYSLLRRAQRRVPARCPRCGQRGVPRGLPPTLCRRARSPGGAQCPQAGHSPEEGALHSFVVSVRSGAANCWCSGLLRMRGEPALAWPP